MTTPGRPGIAVAGYVGALMALLVMDGVAEAEGLPAETRQLLVVSSVGWKADHGELQRWERRKGEGGAWQRVGDPVAIVLGRSGLGWGDGEDGVEGRDPKEPRKHEGDRRAPAGVFTLERSFGVDPAAPSGARTPYLPTTPTLLCVDDAASPDYNRIVETRDARLYKSAEHLRLSNDEYDLALVVGHNKQAVSGHGSCVFMHIWARPGAPTTGCTAMQREQLVEIVRWLDPALQPRLVQLPREAYRARRSSWHLP